MTRAHYILDTEGYTNTHSGCVIVTVFRRIQWLHGGASMLLYTYFAGLVRFMFSRSITVLLRCDVDIT